MTIARSAQQRKRLTALIWLTTLRRFCLVTAQCRPGRVLRIRLRDIAMQVTAAGLAAGGSRQPDVLVTGLARVMSYSSPAARPAGRVPGGPGLTTSSDHLKAAAGQFREVVPAGQRRRSSLTWQSCWTGVDQAAWPARVAQTKRQTLTRVQHPGRAARPHR